MCPCQHTLLYSRAWHFLGHWVNQLKRISGTFPYVTYPKNYPIQWFMSADHHKSAMSFLKVDGIWPLRLKCVAVFFFSQHCISNDFIFLRKPSDSSTTLFTKNVSVKHWYIIWTEYSQYSQYTLFGLSPKSDSLLHTASGLDPSIQHSKKTLPILQES